MASLDAYNALIGPLFDGEVDLLAIVEELVELRPGNGISEGSTKTRDKLAGMLLLYDIAKSLRMIAERPAPKCKAKTASSYSSSIY